MCNKTSSSAFVKILMTFWKIYSRIPILPCHNCIIYKTQWLNLVYRMCPDLCRYLQCFLPRTGPALEICCTRGSRATGTRSDSSGPHSHAEPGDTGTDTEELVRRAQCTRERTLCRGRIWGTDCTEPETSGKTPWNKGQRVMLQKSSSINRWWNKTDKQ